MFKSMLFNASSRRTAAECLAELCLLVFRFWKMADTFTGLKLQGMLGRFGKTPLTDIDGYVELPDGKVCFLTLCLCAHTHTASMTYLVFLFLSPSGDLRFRVGKHATMGRRSDKGRAQT